MPQWQGAVRWLAMSFVTSKMRKARLVLKSRQDVLYDSERIDEDNKLSAKLTVPGMDPEEVAR